MSDAASAPTKSTQLTAPAKSARKQTPKADWRVVVRDGYAAVFDMFGDWSYLYSISHKDYGGDDNSGSDYLPVEIDHHTLVDAAFALCVLSTAFALWTVLTSLGRRAGKDSLCCKCSVPRLALAGIVLEDLPQLALTAYIDFTFEGGLSPAGMLNVCSSLNALVNRATTRYDQILEEETPSQAAAAAFDDTSRMATVYSKMT